MLVVTGPKLTKVCTQCDTLKPIREFYEGRGDCKECKRTHSSVSNAIWIIGDKIAGGQKKRRALPADKRAQIMEHARFLYEIGHQVSHQQIAENAVKSGFVYAITNPAYPDHVKIGRAFDPESRLAGYQTGCPYREYELYDSTYFEDCHSAERNIHDGLSCLREEGEWYRLTAKQAMSVINTYKRALQCGQDS